MYPVVHFKAFEKHDKDLYNYYPIAMSDRKDGALGSTDTKDVKANQVVMESWSL
mgnify:FL=1